MDQLQAPEGQQATPVDSYDEHAEASLQRQREQTERAQEIGPLPPVKDPARRQRCKFDLRLYVLTYFGKACWRGLSSYQDEMVSAFQEVILKGGKKARAVRRGGLKSTIARIAASWAILYGHRKYLVLTGATDDKSNEQRDTFFDMLKSSPELREDFPELIPLLLKRANPKKQLRLDGELLTVSAKDERGQILFPHLEGVESSEARIAPYSILATDVSGIAFVGDDGTVNRPDLLIFDDVQTPQSARSFMMTSARENAICTTFMGLAGLGETMSAIMVCTVREQNDLTCRFCDRKLHPDWDGQKFSVLISEPKDKGHWAMYGERLRQGATPEEGFALATAYYVEHRAEMDEGGKVAWEQDKEDGYISALQWCMTIAILQPAYFRSELQQEGSPPPAGLVQLSADLIVKRLSNIGRGVVPDRSSYLTAFVDSSDEVLWWMVCAWENCFSGWIVDYGTWPNQGREMFYKQHLQVTISQQLPGASWEEAFVSAHNELEKKLTRGWPSENGSSRTLDLLLKDWSDGDHKPRIEAQVAASPNKAIIRPSKGFAPKPGKKPVHLWGDQRRDRHTFMHWIERRSENPVHVQFDANRWKAFVAQRLTTVVGAQACLLLPGHEESRLTLLAEHLTSEVAKKIEWDNTPGTVYESLPGRDNDWFDTLVGNCVAASMLGSALPGETRNESAGARTEVTIPAWMLGGRA